MRTTGGDADGAERHALLMRRIHLLVGAVVGAGAVVVFLVSEVLGYGWGWTGFPDNGHLWDWLHLLVLPLVLLLLPLWLTTRERRRREWRIGLALLALVSAVVVYGGYQLGWDWTGFPGNHLWDWLEMLVLPFTIALLPLWLGAGRLAARHMAASAAAVGLFAVVVICGYAVPWGWTGFQGNTLWDWIQLFIVPFAIPAVVTVLSLAPGLSAEARGDDGEGATV